MDRYELPLDPRHVGVLSGGSNMISEPMVRSVQTEHLSCTDINTISKQTKNELPLNPRHLGVSSGAPKTIFEPIARSTQTVHLSCAETDTISK